jgi:hypothetical protein
MKNIPITQRVNSKSVNGKVTQPILNVGKVEAPAKKMSSPFKMMSSPFKQKAKIYVDPEEGNSAGGATAGSAGKNITDKPITTNLDAAIKSEGTKIVKKSDPKTTALYNERRRLAKERDAQETLDRDKRAGEVEVGPDVDANTDGGKPGAEATLFKNVGGDAQGAAERRENIRNIKNLTGQKKRSEMRLLRAGGKKDADGNSIKKGTQAYKDKKAEIKQDKFSGRNKVIDTEIRNSERQSEENLVGSTRTGHYSGTKVTGVDKGVTKGERTEEQQRVQLEAERNKKYEEVKNNFTFIEGDNGADYESGQVKGSTKKRDPDGPTKKQNGFFGKKSPMKMKYFK